METSKETTQEEHEPVVLSPSDEKAILAALNRKRDAIMMHVKRQYNTGAEVSPWDLLSIREAERDGESPYRRYDYTKPIEEFVKQSRFLRDMNEKVRRYRVHHPKYRVLRYSVRVSFDVDGPGRSSFRIQFWPERDTIK